MTIYLAGAVGYNRYETTISSRLMDFNNKLGRYEYRMIYISINVLLLLAILVISLYYFITEELNQAETTRLVILFTSTLCYVFSSSIAQMLVYYNTAEFSQVTETLSRKEYEFEFEQRINFTYNTITNILFICYITLVYNNIDNIGTLFLSLVVLCAGIYLSLRYSLFLYKYDDMLTFRKKILIINYLVACILVILSLLAASLALVNLN